MSEPVMTDLTVASVAPWPDEDFAMAFLRTRDGGRVHAFRIPRSETGLVTAGGPSCAASSIYGVLGGFLGAAGGRILAVEFAEPAAGMEDCRVAIERDGRRFRIPIRPVDGIALSLANGSPLRASDEVVRRHFQPARVVDQAREGGVTDERVLGAIAATDRAPFVPEALRPFADLDRTLPIGEGQTISQPRLVARMTELLGIGTHDRVLEVGAGCGWQSAILSRLAAKVYAIEIIPVLAERLVERCGRLGLSNVHVHEGDGHIGWPAAAPFDRIVVSCAAPRIPGPLVDQLKPGGRMVIPVHRANGDGEDLTLVKKAQDGTVTEEALMHVWFVPMTGGHS